MNWYMRHVTCDTWHVACDMLHMEGGENSLKLTGPYFLHFRSEGVLKTFVQETRWIDNLAFSPTKQDRVGPSLQFRNSMLTSADMDL